jgi:hypothetical protein
MRITRRWLAGVVAGAGLALTGCQTWVGGMTLPSPRYLEHYPQYFAPDPPVPLPRELASQEDPDAAARRAGGGAGPAPLAPGAPAPGGGPGGAFPPGGGGLAQPGSPNASTPPK